MPKTKIKHEDDGAREIVSELRSIADMIEKKPETPIHCIITLSNGKDLSTWLGAHNANIGLIEAALITLLKDIRGLIPPTVLQLGPIAINVADNEMRGELVGKLSQALANAKTSSTVQPSDVKKDTLPGYS